MKTKIYFMAVVLATVLFSGCAKDGDRGPAGAQGAPGTNGNANVKSQTFIVSNWVISAPDRYATITDLDITQDIVDNGVVLVFRSNGSGGWQQLPYTIPITSTYTTSYLPVYYLNGVTIWREDSDRTQTADPGAILFKVVAIAASGIIKDVDLNNYEAVKKAYNLND